MKHLVPSVEQCATELLEVVPMLMRTIRANVRHHRAPEMSIPQFRSLAYIGRNKGAALSDVASHLGLSLPSTSKLVESLVLAKLATRNIHTGDRRYVVLALTPAGQKRYDGARSQARDFLAKQLLSVGPNGLAHIHEATLVLKSVFSFEEKQKKTVVGSKAAIDPSKNLS